MPEQTETRELACKLNDTELLQRGDAMADAELQIEQLKLKRGELGDKLKAQRALRRKFAGVIDSGEERRDVRCVWQRDDAKNCFRLVRQDTLAEIDTRAMTAADRQEDMGFDGDDSDDDIGDPDETPEPDEDRPARKHLDDDPDGAAEHKHLNA
jgi:hypothetical protein